MQANLVATIDEPVRHRLATDRQRLRHLAELLEAATRYYQHALDGHAVGISSPVPVHDAKAGLARSRNHLARIQGRLHFIEGRLKALSGTGGTRLAS